MSTATINKPTSALIARSGAIARRFAWKELRTLRGLWLAAALLAILIQWLSNILSPPSAPHATILFSTALAAAVLYAVAAAASTFSLEHEDETYDFLAGLPTTWWPVYVGKLTVVAASAAALAALLSLIGWMLHGFETLTPRDAQIVLGVLGVAILEAIAWGTLCSLLTKRPLVAAILALIFGAVSANLALILSASRSGSNLISVAYVEAIPLRLIFVAAALAASAMVARRWLAVGALPAFTVKRGPLARWRGLRTRTTRTRPGGAETTSHRDQRRRMLAHLLWQTWREAEKPLLLPIIVAAVLALGIAVVNTLVEPREKFATAAWLGASLFVPALYGAMAFSADKRRGGYRFLAEHAARPRYVWLARQIVWLGVPLVLAVIAYIAATAIGFRLFAPWLFDTLPWWVEAPEINHGMAASTDQIIQVAALAWWGILAAYSIGQLCSMLIRSEILAAFLALIASLIVTAWCAVCFAWQLTGWLFVLPVAVAFLLATWLRAPDWLTVRNTWRAWLKPVLAVIAPFVLIGVALPTVRLAQLDALPRMFHVPLREVSSEFPGNIQSLIDAYTAPDTPESRETVKMYERALEAFDSWHDSNPLEPWQKSEYLSSEKKGEIDEAKIPPDQLEAYRAARNRVLEAMRQSHAAAIKLAIEASTRPSCLFDFGMDQSSSVWHPLYDKLNQLLAVLSSIEPHEPFDRLLAALRMSGHLRTGQPSAVFTHQLTFQETDVLQKIGEWAGHESRTKEELAAALKQLNATFSSWPSMQGALVADHRLVQDALLGKTVPVVLDEKPDSPEVYLAYLANHLPWEQRRALKALDRITVQNLHYAERISDVTGAYLPELGIFTLRTLLQPNRSSSLGTDSWVVAQPAAATSYLTRLEYQARTDPQWMYRAYLENETRRGAVRLQIALAMYRGDHNAYPTALNQLVPDYVGRLPHDPFSQQPFEYEPHGLNLPLRNTWIGRLEPNTAFVWSPGLGNARIKQQEHFESEIDEADPQRGLLHTLEDVYQLISDDPSWAMEPVFVFPLPK